MNNGKIDDQPHSLITGDDSDSSISSTRIFQKVKPVSEAGEEEEDLFQSVLGSLGSSLKEKGGELATGWIMNLIGSGGGSDPLEKVKKQLEEQKAQLNVIEQKLDALSRQIKEAVDQIEDKVEQESYNTAVRILESNIAIITAKYQQLSFYAGSDPDPKQKNVISTLAKEIQDLIPPAFISIYDTLMGTAAGAEGILALWSRLSFKHSDDIDKYADKIHQQFMYYYCLQVKALQLIIESYHCDPPDTSMAQQYFKTWTTQLNEEITEYMKSVPRSKLQKTISVTSDPLCISAGEEFIYVLLADRLLTIRKSDWSLVHTLMKPDYAGVNVHMVVVNGYAYIIASYIHGWEVDMDFYKVSLSGEPAIQAHLRYRPMGPGGINYGYPAGMAADSSCVYCLCCILGVDGYTIKVIDQDSFQFADAKEFSNNDKNQGLSGLAGLNGFLVAGGLLYYYVSEKYNILKVLDIQAKRIVSSTGINNGGGGNHWIVKQGDILWSICGASTIDIFKLQDPTHPQWTDRFEALDVIKSFQAEADSNISYYTQGLPNDPGDLNFLYYSSQASPMKKTMPWPGGIKSLFIDGPLLYAGSVAGSNNINVLTYKHTIDKTKIPE